MSGVALTARLIDTREDLGLNFFSSLLAFTICFMKLVPYQWSIKYCVVTTSQASLYVFGGGV